MLKGYIKKLTAHSFIYGIGTVIPQVTAVALIPIYTRFLSTQDYGILAVMGTFIYVLSLVLGQGQPISLTRNFYLYKKSGTHTVYFKTIFLYLLCSCFIIVGLLTVIGLWIRPAIFQNVAFNPYCLIALWIAFVAVIFDYFMLILRLENKAKTYVIFTLISFFAETGCVVYFVCVYRWGATGSLAGRLVGGVLIILFLLFIINRYLKGRFDSTLIMDSLLFGLPSLPSKIGLRFLNVADIVLLERLASLSQLGLYSLGYKYAAALLLITNAVRNTLIPTFYESDANGELQLVFPQLLRFYFVFLLACVVVLSIFAREVISLLAAPEYHASYTVVPFLLFSVMGLGLYQIFVQGIIVRNKVTLLPILSWMALAINVGLNIFMIPRFGMMGAAWTSAVSSSILCIAGIFFAIKLLPLKLDVIRFIASLILAVGFVMLGTILDFQEYGAAYRMILKSGAVVLFGVMTLFVSFCNVERQHLRDYLLNRLRKAGVWR
jgi:O-antigen/teichoic acid export membrane protein